MFRIVFSPGVADDLKHVRAHDRSRVLDRIEALLGTEPTVVTRHRKLLHGIEPPWDQETPVWELRVGEYRVFYDVDEANELVTIRAIRHKPPHATTEDIL
jgi:mRNA-degrading endonuclease RelE of RelBE toxin-antitoxin system